MNDGDVTLVSRDGVAIVTLARGDGGNALSLALVDALTARLHAVAADPAIGAVLIAAEGRHFSVGGDLAAFAVWAEEAPAVRRARFAVLLERAEAMLAVLVAMPVPVIVACTGTIAGGAIGLVLAADLAFGDDRTVFRFSWRAAGVPPDGGVSWLLPRIVGPRRAAQLLLQGAEVAAAEALDLGLLSHRVAAGCAGEAALAAARDLAAAPSAAVRGAKALLAQSAGADFAAHLAAERAGVVDAVGGDDFVARIRSLNAGRGHRGGA